MQLKSQAMTRSSNAAASAFRSKMRQVKGKSLVSITLDLAPRTSLHHAPQTVLRLRNIEAAEPVCRINLLNATTAFSPPNAKEFEIAYSHFRFRAQFGM